MSDYERPQVPHMSPTRRGVLSVAGALAAGALATGAASACGAGGHPAVATPVRRRRGGNLRVGLTGGSARTLLTRTSRHRSRHLAGAGAVRAAGQAQPPGRRNTCSPTRSPPATARQRVGHPAAAGVTFHDGKPLTSQDVLFSFRSIVPRVLGHDLPRPDRHQRHHSTGQPLPSWCHVAPVCHFAGAAALGSDRP